VPGDMPFGKWLPEVREAATKRQAVEAGTAYMHARPKSRQEAAAGRHPFSCLDVNKIG
jgi:hypothetical protein